MGSATELDEIEAFTALEESRADYGASTLSGRGDSVVEDSVEMDKPVPPTSVARLGVLTSGGVYDEIRRRLALLGYRWE